MLSLHLNPLSSAPASGRIEVPSVKMATCGHIRAPQSDAYSGRSAVTVVWPRTCAADRKIGVCRNDEEIACRAGTLICALHQLSPIFRSLLRYLRVRVELVFKPTWESPERWAASLIIEPLFRSHHYGDLFINEHRTSVALLKALVQFSGHVSQHPLGKW